MSSTSDIAARHGELKSKGLDLGAPSGSEEDVGLGGRFQAFQNGRIYWHPQIGAHEVHGATLTKYLELGGPGDHPGTGRPELGFPRSDETQTPEGFARVSEFEHGAIYHGYDAGAVALYGPIYKEWSTRYAQTSVSLGFPLIEPFSLTADTQAAIFSNGFSFTFGPEKAVFAGHYDGPMPGKPEIVTPDARDIAAFQIALPVGIWKAIQRHPDSFNKLQPKPNLLIRMWEDRLVLQRVNNPRSLIPLVVEMEEAKDGGITAGKSDGNNSPGVAPADPAFVTLRLKVRLAPGALMADRSLYNIAVRLPNGSAAAIGLHAIYAKKDWQNFGILHVTDIHVTGRSDAIFFTLRHLERNESVREFNNFNDGFRDFIRYANHLHDNGLIDLIVATGDLVDYQFEGDGNTPNNLGGSFLLFELLMRGASPSPLGSIVEALRVPIFTTLGNHDYRKIPYGLLVDVDIPVVSDREISNYESFNLTRKDAEALQGGGKPTISPDAAMAQVRVNRPHHYFKRINTVSDDDGSSYLVRLGPNHRIVILDSKHDIGIIDSKFEGFKVEVLGVGSEDQKTFADASPSQVGVSDRHLALLSQAMTEAGKEGVVIVGIHGPPINIKGGEFAPYFRETEHPLSDKKDIIAFLTRRAPIGHFGVDSQIGPQNVVVKIGGKITNILWERAEKIARDLHPGWMKSIGQRFFMSGTVADLLDQDVSKGRMDDFLKLCAGVSIPGINAPRPIDLVLCGHGHKRVEYRVRWDAAEKQMLYFTDFYTENPSEYYGTFKGSFDFGNQRVRVLVQSGGPIPGTVSKGVQDPLSAGEELALKTQPYGTTLNSSGDKAAWWTKHRPVLMQTAALGPMTNDRKEPGKRRPDPIFQGFRVISITGKSISSIRYVTLRELRANNFKMPFEDARPPGSTIIPVGSGKPPVAKL